MSGIVSFVYKVVEFMCEFRSVLPIEMVEFKSKYELFLNFWLRDKVELNVFEIDFPFEVWFISFLKSPKSENVLLAVCAKLVEDELLNDG